MYVPKYIEIPDVLANDEIIAYTVLRDIVHSNTDDQLTTLKALVWIDRRRVFNFLRHPFVAVFDRSRRAAILNAVLR